MRSSRVTSSPPEHPPGGAALHPRLCCCYPGPHVSLAPVNPVWQPTAPPLASHRPALRPGGGGGAVPAGCWFWRQGQATRCRRRSRAARAASRGPGILDLSPRLQKSPAGKTPTGGGLRRGHGHPEHRQSSRGVWVGISRHSASVSPREPSGATCVTLLWVPGADACLRPCPSCWASEQLDAIFWDLFTLSLGTPAEHPEGTRARPLGRLQLLAWHLAVPRATHEHLKHAASRGRLALPGSPEATGVPSLAAEGQPWAATRQEEEAALPGGVFLHSVNAAETCRAGFGAEGSAEAGSCRDG